MNELPDKFPEVTHEELLETIAEVFRTGANEIDPREIFGDDLKSVPTTSRKNVPTMFPHEESTT